MTFIRFDEIQIPQKLKEVVEDSLNKIKKNQQKLVKKSLKEKLKLYR